MKLVEVLEKFALEHARAAVSVPELVIQVLGAAAGGEGLRRGVERILTKRFAAEQGRAGAMSLSRALTKQIDAVFEQEMRGVTAEQRRALVRPLAEAAALHLVEAAHALADYVDKAADVNVAKELRDTSKLVAARRARLEVDQRLDRALLAASRAVSGGETP